MRQYQEWRGSNVVGPACRVSRVNKGLERLPRVPLLQDVLQMPRGRSWLNTPQDDLSLSLSADSDTTWKQPPRRTAKSETWGSRPCWKESLLGSRAVKKLQRSCHFATTVLKRLHCALIKSGFATDLCCGCISNAILQHAYTELCLSCACKRCRIFLLHPSLRMSMSRTKLLFHVCQRYVEQKHKPLKFCKRQRDP